MIRKYIFAAYIGIKGGRIRTLLAILGITAGIFLVITLLAAARGVQTQIKQQVTTLGTDIIAINSVNATDTSGGDLVVGGLATPTLTIDDLAAIKKVATISAAAPVRYLGGEVEYSNKKTTPTFIAATTYEYPRARDFVLRSGRFFTKEEQSEKKLSVVIGTSTQQTLFPNQNPLGKEIAYGDMRLRVVGVAEKISSAPDTIAANNLDNAIYAPPAIVGQPNDQTVTYSMILARVNETANVEIAQKQIKQNLTAYRSENSFSVVTEAGRVNTTQTILNVLTAFVGVVGGVSLCISGIGIMNMMIVAVTDRTKEIGVRKTVGATSKNIFTHFLIETILLTLLGGIIGVGAAAVTLGVISRFLPIAPEFTLDLVVLGLGLSVIVGVVFGVGPALSAARKEPIEALQTDHS